MNENPVIRFRDVSLRYPLRSRSMKVGFLHMLGYTADTDFQALCGVNLEVHESEVLGIIGSNGSGKSTLARMVAGVYFPDAGEVCVNGKVSLLTLGAGFSYELTGRENIFINGAFHGLSRKEIATRVKEIIDFADIGGFIDQPIKMYSSGMRSRLAFAIAVSLKPEVLIIDEALSTGDVSFRRKAQTRVTEMVNEAKCVLIVSHQMRFLQEICSRIVWMDRGRVVLDGNPKKVIQRYEQEMGADD